MKKLKIEKIDNFNYFLKDNDENKYEINIELYDIQDEINIGDNIYMHDELLKEKILNFGSLDSMYGRKINEPDDIDIIILEIKDKKIYLKRIYG